MKYRCRPNIVEAEQFHPDKSPWPEGVSEINPGWKQQSIDSEGSRRFHFIGTGAWPIQVGDWVVTNSAGRRYVVGMFDFFDFYERVPETPNG